LFFSFHWT